MNLNISALLHENFITLHQFSEKREKDDFIQKSGPH